VAVDAGGWRLEGLEEVSEVDEGEDCGD